MRSLIGFEAAAILLRTIAFLELLILNITLNVFVYILDINLLIYINLNFLYYVL